MKRPDLIVLSGPLASGKTTLAINLETTYQVVIVRVRAEIAKATSIDVHERRELLVAGSELERRTGGTWLVEPVNSVLATIDSDWTVVVDAVRTVEQVAALRDTGLRPVCIHLTASTDARAMRFANLVREDDQVPFDEAAQHPTEAGAESLRFEANLLIDTTELRTLDVVRVATAFVNLPPKPA